MILSATQSSYRPANTGLSGCITKKHKKETIEMKKPKALMFQEVKLDSIKAVVKSMLDSYAIEDDVYTRRYKMNTYEKIIDCIVNLMPSK